MYKCKLAVILLLVTAKIVFSSPQDIAGGTIEIKNDYYTFKFNCDKGLQLEEIYNKYTNDNNIKDDKNLYFGVIELDGEMFTLDAMNVDQVQKNHGEVIFCLSNPVVKCEVKVLYDETAESRWQLRIQNISGDKAVIKVSFPVISGLIMGDCLEDIEFYHGLNGGMFGKEPVFLRGSHGYSFPILDIYNKKSGGLYLISPDESQALKGYDVIKKESGKTPKLSDHCYWQVIRGENLFDFDQGCGMSVTQRQFELEDGSEYTTPQVILGVHPYRWEKAWESYRDWLKSVTPDRKPIKWFRRILFSKALHQGHYHSGNNYEFSKNINEFDGKYTMFNLNHWMDNRGDYNVREDWGGPKLFKRELNSVRKKGLHSALYLEAVCVGQEAKVAKEHALNWAVLKDGQKVKTEDVHEWNMCPGSRWTDYISETCSRLVQQTNCDAIYLDSMALRYNMCEDKAHNHPYKRGWHKNVEEVFENVSNHIDRVKQNTPVFAEFYSSGINARYISGSYSPVVTAAIGLTRQGFDFAKTGTNLYRFYFPQYKVIEIMPYDREGIGLSLFNGNAMHHYFITSHLWPLLTECARVWGQNVEAFTSDHPEALVDTGVDDLFMNKFPGENKTIYTLWNSGQADCPAAPILFPVKADHRYIDLFNHKKLKTEKNKLLVNAPVKEIAIFAEFPEILDINTESTGDITVNYNGMFTAPSLVIYAKTKNEKPTLLFEDNFTGKCDLEPDKWLVPNKDNARLSGNDTAIFQTTGNWTNPDNSQQWNYTKTHTVEISCRFMNQEIKTQPYLLIGNKTGSNPRLELYPNRSTPMIYYTDSSGQGGFLTDGIKPCLKGNFNDDFQKIKMVLNQNWRRVYINNEFYCEIPLAHANHPSEEWRLGLAGNKECGFEVDYVKIYEGNTSTCSSRWKKRTLEFPKKELAINSNDYQLRSGGRVIADSLAFNPEELFQSSEVTHLSIQLIDGETLIDEYVVK